MHFIFKARKEIITLSSAGLYLVMLLAWYMYVSSGTVFSSVVHIGDFIFTNISTELLNPAARSAIILKAIGMEPSISFTHTIGDWLYRITMLFIILGVLRWILRRQEMKFSQAYIAFSVGGIVLVGVAVLIPCFSLAALDMTRIYHLSLFFLSPFCILVGEAVFRWMPRLFRFRLSKRLAISLLTLIVLIPYFLFTSGFIFEVTKDYPTSLPLSITRVDNSGDENAKTAFDYLHNREQNVSSAKWLSRYKVDLAPVHVNRYHHCSVLASYGMMPESLRYLTSHTRLNRGDYIYLGYLNVVDGLFSEPPGPTSAYGREIFHTNKISQLLRASSKIYSNGGSEIYKCE